MAQNWFKHDYNARNDEKILELRAEYGWKGYGLFFGIIEFMCETETGCLDTERIGGLSVAYNLPKDELLGFISFCIDIDLFFEDEDGLIKSGRVVTHLEKMNTYKQAGKKGAKKRWNKKSDEGGNRGAISDPNADKIREDKNREDNNNYVQFVYLWNDVNECNLRITDKKREQIRARLRTYSEDELKTSIRNRSEDDWINGEGKKYKTNWDSFWRNDEKPERYLTQNENGQYKVIDGGTW